MNILKIKLFVIFVMLFFSSLLSGQGAFLESQVKADADGNVCGLHIYNDLLEEYDEYEGNSFIGFEYHNHGNHSHYRIAMRAKTAPGSNGVFVGETGQLAVGTEDPCARILDESTMLSVEGGAFKVDGPMWTEEDNVNLMKNITPLENSIEKFMQVKFYRYEHKSTSEIRYGVIGDEIKEAFPSSVKSLKRHNEEHHYFNASNLFYAGMKAIQENNKEIIRQDEHIQTLETENQRLSIKLETERVKNDKQQEIIEAQEKKITMLEERLAKIEAALTNNTNETDINRQNIQLNERSAYLEQNQPNPFNQNTLIKYRIPMDAANAVINIFDAKGQLIHSERIVQVGVGEIQIKAGTIVAGTYNYSLVVNGNVVDTKRMVIVK